MNVFSYSRLQRYRECPQSFYFKYLLELEEPTSDVNAGVILYKNAD